MLVFETFEQNKIKYEIKCSDNIFDNTVVITNEDTIGYTILEKFDYKNVKKAIKYFEGIKWNDWNTNIDQTLKTINNTMIDKISKQVGGEYEIVFNKVNKNRESCDCSRKIIVDCDILIYKQSMTHAYHYKVVYYVDLETDILDIVVVKLIGKVLEKYLYDDNIEYSNITDKHIYKDENFARVSLETEDTIYDIIDQDRKVIDMLYTKFMTVDLQNEEYKTNVSFKKNHDFVRNMFMSKLTNNDSVSSSKYEILTK